MSYEDEVKRLVATGIGDERAAREFLDICQQIREREERRKQAAWHERRKHLVWEDVDVASMPLPRRYIIEYCPEAELFNAWTPEGNTLLCHSGGRQAIKQFLFKRGWVELAQPR